MQHFDHIVSETLIKDGITRCAPGACHVYHQPHGPGQHEDKQDKGADFHEPVDAPSHPTAV